MGLAAPVRCFQFRFFGGSKLDRVLNPPCPFVVSDAPALTLHGIVGGLQPR
jgi:hypothetical protein